MRSRCDDARWVCARAQCAARERVDWGQVPTRRLVWLPSDIGGPQVALGRAGDGPKVFPWWEAALVGRSAAPEEAIFVHRLFRGLPPLGFGLDLLPEVRLGRILKDF